MFKFLAGLILLALTYTTAEIEYYEFATQSLVIGTALIGAGLDTIFHKK